MVCSTISYTCRTYSSMCPGYFGAECTPCPAGRYGNECEGRCYPECPVEYCNHVKGCFWKIENTTLSFTPGMRNKREEWGNRKDF